MGYGSGGRDDHWYWLMLDEDTGDVFIEHQYSIFHQNRADDKGTERLSIDELKLNRREIFDNAIRLILHGFPAVEDQDKEKYVFDEQA